jgi:hypothetical protein
MTFSTTIASNGKRIADMGKVTITVDDISPQIVYNGTWVRDSELLLLVRFAIRSFRRERADTSADRDGISSAQPAMGRARPSRSGARSLLPRPTATRRRSDSTGRGASQPIVLLAPGRFGARAHASVLPLLCPSVHPAPLSTHLRSLSLRLDSIALYGTHYVDHGTFSVLVDDGPVTSINGLTSQLEIGAQLYSRDGLDPTNEHQITVTNKGSSWLDLDYITYQVDVGGDK